MCIIEEIQVDYFIAGSTDSDIEFNELCQKVRDFEKGNK